MEKSIIQIKRIFETLGFVDTQDHFSGNVYKGNITAMWLNDDKTKLTLVCLRPGLIIGKGGKNFDYISSAISDYLGQVEIEIIEDKFWDCWN